MSEALKTVTTEIERGTAKLGWDQPPALYALVPTSALLKEGDLPEDIAAQLRSEWDGSDDHLSAILQETLAKDELEEMLPRLAWPDSVAGVAVSVERVVVPPEVEEAAPEDEEEAIEFISNHPARSDVRITVGAMRDGSTWSLLRARNFDSDDKVGAGEALVPQLNELLLASLSPDER